MEYIKAEEFLKQSIEVQQVLRDYAEENFSRFDLVHVFDENKTFNITGVLDTRNDDINVGRVFFINNCPLWDSMQDPNIIPLFTEGILRKFIEDKTCGISSIRIKCNEVEINLYTNDSPTHIKRHSQLGSDLLKAYWKVVCKIASEEVENNVKNSL